MKFITILLSILYINFISCFHLNPTQIQTINHLIQKNKLTRDQREQINIILYNSYKKYAIKKTYEFKKIHSYKCQDIDTDELLFSSYIGLYKGIRKYNGQIPLHKHSDIYIKSELLKTITEKFNLSPIPKSVRKQGKVNLTTIEKNTYKQNLEPKLVSYDNYWQFDKIYKNNIMRPVYDDILEKEYYTNIWQIINNLEPYDRKIFHYKYDFYLNKLRSNKSISEALYCSEEAIRKRLIKISKILYNNLKLFKQNNVI